MMSIGVTNPSVKDEIPHHPENNRLLSPTLLGRSELELLERFKDRVEAMLLVLALGAIWVVIRKDLTDQFVTVNQVFERLASPIRLNKRQ